MMSRCAGLMLVGIVVASCAGESTVGLPACDPSSSPEVVAITTARDAMNVIPLATEDQSFTWEALCVRLSSVEPVAFETGEWSETDGEDSFAAGSYAATWRKAAGGWLVVDTIKTIEGCSGKLCP